jgi:hypothetical protein
MTSASFFREAIKFECFGVGQAECPNDEPASARHAAFTRLVCSILHLCPHAWSVTTERTYFKAVLLFAPFIVCIAFLAPTITRTARVAKPPTPN